MKAKAMLFALAVASVAHADPLPIKGTFAFDIMNPKKSKCTKVDGALLAKLTKSYACAAPDDPKSSASGKPLVGKCEIKKGKGSTYFLLGSVKDCTEERETQLANGGD